MGGESGLPYFQGNGITRIEKSFVAAKGRCEAALLPFIAGGYETAGDTTGILLAMQKGGADIIELGVPCTSPFADGPTIQNSYRVAIENGTAGVHDCLHIVKAARSKGLTVPIILMGYYEMFQKEYDFDLERMCRDAAESGVDGFLAVGIGEGKQELDFNKHCHQYNLSNIQLVMFSSSDKRISDLANMASTFLYIVSVRGRTGARDSLPEGLEERVARVRSKTDLPLVIGFGISSPNMVCGVGSISDGAVVGSFLTDCLNKTDWEKTDEMHHQISRLKTGTAQKETAKYQATRFSRVPVCIENEERAKRS